MRIKKLVKYCAYAALYYRRSEVQKRSNINQICWRRGQISSARKFNANTFSVQSNTAKTKVTLQSRVHSRVTGERFIAYIGGRFAPSMFERNFRRHTAQWSLQDEVNTRNGNSTPAHIYSCTPGPTARRAGRRRAGRPSRTTERAHPHPHTTSHTCTSTPQRLACDTRQRDGRLRYAHSCQCASITYVGSADC